MQQDQAGAEFQHGACASTFPSPKLKPFWIGIKEGKKGGKKIPARGYFMEKGGFGCCFFILQKEFYDIKRECSHLLKS